MFDALVLVTTFGTLLGILGWLVWQVVRDIRHPPLPKPPIVDGWLGRIAALIVAGLSLTIIVGILNHCGGVPGACGQGNDAWIIAGTAFLALLVAVPKLLRWFGPGKGERRS